jgi:hypothetical protein
VVAESLVGSDVVVDLAESPDFHGEGVAVVDRGAVEVFVFQGFEQRSTTPLVSGI